MLGRALSHMPSKAAWHGDEKDCEFHASKQQKTDADAVTRLLGQKNLETYALATTKLGVLALA